ncbi:MAG: peptidase M16 [Idiomarina sp.]|nr:peptidase M16 [Idiomarina sp.]
MSQAPHVVRPNFACSCLGLTTLPSHTSMQHSDPHQTTSAQASTPVPKATQLLDDLIKSPNDTRKYRLVELKNGLEVLLVHDESTTHSAASLAIRAGHFQDPMDAQGLAHFLEHMLFMGTEQTPEPNVYPDFVGQHGGQHNAWTGTEHTNFYFDIRAPQFAQGLALFAQLFIAPLFKPEWIAKELQSVEAEYRMKLNDELRRLYQVHKETANPAHPFTKFSVGNAATLQNYAENSLQQQLRTFFKTWYHARNMRLVLVGPQSLDELEGLSVRYFSDIATEGETPSAIQAPLYLKSQQGVVVHVRPLKNACRMILTLPLPGIDDDYPYKTTTLLAHLLGYEGPGSLTSQLKSLGLATDLSAGGGINGSNFKDFNFNIQLTEQGLAQYDTVCQLIFQAIRQLSRQDLASPHYAERQQMVALSFRYQEPIRSLELASQLSINMLHYRRDDIIQGDYLMREFNAAQAERLLAHMQPERARVVLIHHSLPVNQTTQLYETAYRIAPLSEAQLARFNCDADVLLELPSANPFIPRRLEAMPLRDQDTRLPNLLAGVPALSLWHFQDPEFRVPKGHIYLSLALPRATNTKSAFAHARVWCELVLDALNERCYDAEVAGMQFNVYPQQSGISIHISGFSERQPELLSLILNSLTDFEFNPQHFQHIRHQLYHNWLAVNRHKPINHLFTVLNQTLQRGCYIGAELATELETMDAHSFAQKMPLIFAQMNVTALVCGDWPVDVAQRIGRALTHQLSLSGRPQQAPLREVTLLQPGKAESIHCQLPHPDHAVALFCQGQSISDLEKAAFLLLNHIISPSFFNQLRTEQQLGYMVGNSYVPMNGRPGLLFYVQSPHTVLAELERAIESFIEDFCAQLPQLPEALWQDAKHSVVSQLTDADPNLRIRAQRFWTSISIDDVKFDLAKRMAALIDEMSLASLTDIARQRLLAQSARLWLTCTQGNDSQAGQQNHANYGVDNEDD